MDSLAGPLDTGLDHADSPNLRVVKEMFEMLSEVGPVAAIEHLLQHAHADVEFRPYTGAGRVLRGRDEVRAFYRGEVESGTSFTARPTNFEECSDEVVVVTGSLRVGRPAGGFAESQLCWTYRFRDGRLQTAGWGPRTV
jgi:ketosteroid isomerase-like protein